MDDERADMSVNSGAAPTLHPPSSHRSNLPSLESQSHRSRRAMLNSYASVLSSRDEALDSKANALLEKENDVRDASFENERERDRLAELERKMRLDMASFLEEISSKQAVLMEIEVW